MAIGEAKRLHRATGQPVMIVGLDGRPVKSDLFNDVPYLITRPLPGNGPYQRLINCGGKRPYIRSKTGMQWEWRAYEPEPADLVFTASELEFARPYKGSILFEPNVKNIGHDNKDWGDANWQQFDKFLLQSDLGRVIQCVSGDRRLFAVEHVQTPTFRHAMAVLSVCRAFVGAEGGLMHAAAAVGIPGVIVFGGFISPRVTGYSLHRNLFTGIGLGCGKRTNCQHCRECMRRITPEQVLSELKQILQAEK